MQDKRNDELGAKIKAIEVLMGATDFWADKERAQETLTEYQSLKEELVSGDKYGKYNAIVTIMAGAGGDDAEDFATMLKRMYSRFVATKGWSEELLSVNASSAGYRSVSFIITGKGAYGTLKGESGVHRLVRISPFNAQGKRQTSFVMVEVVPELTELPEIALPESDLDVQFSRAGGKGGQNVNKVETAVRITHIPSGITVKCTEERSQQKNREKAMSMLLGKLYKKQQEDREKESKGLSISDKVDNEWGNQMRSYVLHPYKLVKDHEKNIETSNVDAVLEGDISLFLG